MLITDISNWQEEHTKQAARDHVDLMGMLSDIKLRQEIESNLRSSQIGTLHDELTAFYRLVQNVRSMLFPVTNKMKPNFRRFFS